MLCVSICVRRKARLRIAEQIQVYENAQTACGLRAFGVYGNSTARPVQPGDAPSFYGVVGALLRGSHRCVSLGALFRTHLPCQRGHQGAIHNPLWADSAKGLSRITAGRPIICIATFTTTSFTFPTDCRQQLLQQPCQIMPIRSIGDIVVLWFPTAQ